MVNNGATLYAGLVRPGEAPKFTNSDPKTAAAQFGTAREKARKLEEELELRTNFYDTAREKARKLEEELEFRTDFYKLRLRWAEQQAAQQRS